MEDWPSHYSDATVGCTRDKWDTLQSCSQSAWPDRIEDPFALAAPLKVGAHHREGQVKFDFSGMSDALAEFIRDRVNTISATFVARLREVRACMASRLARPDRFGGPAQASAGGPPHADFEPIAQASNASRTSCKQAEFTDSAGCAIDLLEADPTRSVQRD